tara:strand:- start:64 stop:267 length:204 start_codon:yes stop_codon:yes gene_type:complete
MVRGVLLPRCPELGYPIMCPICWISGFIALLFGGSFIAVDNHPISWILGFVLIIYSIFKFYEAKKIT